MKIRTNDGATFEGRSAKQIVSRMRRDQWNAPELKQEYMEQVSNRVAQMYGHIVHITSAQEFLRGLEEAGLIERL
jgi:hypothetical protein